MWMSLRVAKWRGQYVGKGGTFAFACVKSWLEVVVEVVDVGGVDVVVDVDVAGDKNKLFL